MAVLGVEGHVWLTVLAAVCWGATNPFLKAGGNGVDTVQGSGSQWKYLLSRWRYTLPLAINQCGSVLFSAALATTEVSIAVPVTNSLTFCFTALAGMAVGEQRPSALSCCGVVLVLAGVYVCLSAKDSPAE